MTDTTPQAAGESREAAAWQERTFYDEGFDDSPKWGAWHQCRGKPSDETLTREKNLGIKREYRALYLAEAPAAEVVNAAIATPAAAADAWPHYIAHIIEGYLQGDPAPDKREGAIAGIIRRRMWSATPVVQGEPPKCWACNDTKKVITSSNGSGLIEEECACTYPAAAAEPAIYINEKGELVSRVSREQVLAVLSPIVSALEEDSRATPAPSPKEPTEADEQKAVEKWATLLGFGRDEKERCDFRAGYRAALATRGPIGAVEPSEWKWVPVQPTDAMAAAAIKASLAEPSAINGMPQWEAMLDAAPSPREPTKPSDDLVFVERWAVHHASKPRMTAEEALSVIAHYPPIRKITLSYADGKRPETFDPYAEIERLRAILALRTPLEGKGEPQC